jgi:hypothetical protein
VDATVLAGQWEFEQIIERRIMERTWRRIHLLDVEVKAGRVVVTGQTRWYYAKQLAIHAVLEACREAGATPVIDMRIRVVPPPSRGRERAPVSTQPSSPKSPEDVPAAVPRDRRGKPHADGVPSSPSVP